MPDIHRAKALAVIPQHQSRVVKNPATGAEQVLPASPGGKPGEVLKFDFDIPNHKAAYKHLLSYGAILPIEEPTVKEPERDRVPEVAPAPVMPVPDPVEVVKEVAAERAEAPPAETFTTAEGEVETKPLAHLHPDTLPLETKELGLTLQSPMVDLEFVEEMLAGRLKAIGVETIEDLAAVTDTELRAVQGVGHRTLEKFRFAYEELKGESADG